MSLAAAIVANPALAVYGPLQCPRGIYTWPAHGGTVGILDCQAFPHVLTLNGQRRIVAAAAHSGGLRLTAEGGNEVFDVGTMHNHPEFDFSILHRRKVDQGGAAGGVFMHIATYVT